eukprot:TRINITY_DN51837_c1_g1_i2.p1 TRINITY_DN51837_c1_g1~~TRINITY_DN51837_c1_g1_i2.p1  ORF type:complete len:396 (-),score=58.36 TRINITY_DN51837_c1_g1_i2:32-1219(-)
MKAGIVFKGLLVIGLSTGLYASEALNIEKVSPKVQTLITKYKLDVVDYTYAKAKMAKGTVDGAKAIFVDARPNKKYKAGTIPSSINIPDTEYKKYIGQLKNTAKNKEILVFCGGWKCGKSPKVANMLKKDGFTNVKLYQAGEPEWSKKNYKQIDLSVIKSAQEKNSAFLIDARPYVKFLQETIPGSISIPDTELEKLKGRFPVNHKEKVIVFCGGYKCVKSHNIAKKLISMGYRDVSVFAAGVPAWKKAGLATTKSAAKKVEKTLDKKPMFSKNGAKLGADEGSIDGEWLYSLIKQDKVPSFIQIVDVTSADEYKQGHLKGAISVTAENYSAKELLSKLPKGKTTVFNCTAGGRSIDAWTKLNEAGIDVSEIFYFDANIDCKGNDCKIEVNEPID